MNRILYTILILLFAVRAEAAMVRVLAIENARTLTVADQNGNRFRVILAGIAITDELRARELLRWTVGSAWVMLESRGGEVLAYRSPDALFINRELVLRGYARATLPGIAPAYHLDVTYLGQLEPEVRERGSSGGAPRKSSGTSTRSRGTQRSESPRPSASGTRQPGAGSRGRSSGSRTRDPHSPRSSG